MVRQQDEADWLLRSSIQPSASRQHLTLRVCTDPLLITWWSMEFQSCRLTLPTSGACQATSSSRFHCSGRPRDPDRTDPGRYFLCATTISSLNGLASLATEQKMLSAATLPTAFG